MKNLFWTVLILSVLASAATGQSTSPPQNDNQFWNETQFYVPLGCDTKAKQAERAKKDNPNAEKDNPNAEKAEKDDRCESAGRLDLVLTGNLRAGRDFNRLVDERIGIGIEYKTRKLDNLSDSLKRDVSLTLNASYLYRAAQPFAGRRDFESRFITFATPEITLIKGKTTVMVGKDEEKMPDKRPEVSFKNRNRFEYQSKNNRPNTLVYRNRSLFEIKMKIWGDENKVTWDLKPFAYGEYFYDGRKDDWVRQRYGFGLGNDFKFQSFELKTEVYYLRQIDDVSRPGNLHVFGTSLKILLRRKLFKR